MNTEETKKSGMFWHIHHNVLVEWSDNIDERIYYIKKNKPANEIEIRLRLMKPVKGKLPTEMVKAYKAWDKAYKARNKADKAREKADKAWDKAWVKYASQIERLHAEECDCKEWNGRELVFRGKEIK